MLGRLLALLIEQSFHSSVHERQVSFRFLVAVTPLSVYCVLPEQLSKAYWDVSFVAVGAVGTAENVSGEFLGQPVFDGYLLCQLKLRRKGSRPCKADYFGANFDELAPKWSS